jgi:molybdenum cofactor cytidylyltransferase
MVAGVILSAGEGKRMGSVPKALLKIDNRTFLETISENLFIAGLEDVYVLLGYYSDLIESEVSLKREKILINPHPEMGQLSSLMVAIRNMPDKVSAIMVTLVDLPLIRLSTYSGLIRQWEGKKDFIHVCIYNGRRGHPVIFPRRFFQELLTTPLEEGARAVVRSHLEEVITWDEGDPGIFMDFDTEEDYQKVRY